jgi:hypothetical protein
VIIIIIFVSAQRISIENFRIITGSMPSFEIIKGKDIQSITWHQAVHPIACNMIGKKH